MKANSILKRIGNKRTTGLLLALIISFCLICLLSGPVLFKTNLLADLFGSICDPPLVIMNPLRDRAPEKAADLFLKRVQSKDRVEVLSPLFKDNEAFEHVNSREEEYPLKAWEDYSREDMGDEVVLVYWPTRQNYGDAHAPDTVVVVKKVSDEYKIVSYSPAY